MSNSFFKSYLSEHLDSELIGWHAFSHVLKFLILPMDFGLHLNSEKDTCEAFSFVASFGFGEAFNLSIGYIATLVICNGFGQYFIANLVAIFPFVLCHDESRVLNCFCELTAICYLKIFTIKLSNCCQLHNIACKYLVSLRVGQIKIGYLPESN